MKRLVGWCFVALGGAAGLWGGYCYLTGSTRARIDLTPDLSIDALTAGLAGAAVFTVGLVWVRD